MPRATRTQASEHEAGTLRVSQSREQPAGFADQRASAAAQRQAADLAGRGPRVSAQLAQRAVIDQGAARANRTGLPDSLKAGVENLSGMSMDAVKVHYNSARPAQLNAHAYAQGNEIHVGPGQERHLPHEAWHVVQQRQGRVRATMQMAGVQVNDDAGLEREADAMGARAMSGGAAAKSQPGDAPAVAQATSPVHGPAQRAVVLDDASDFETLGSDEILTSGSDLEDICDELEEDFDWSKHLIRLLKEYVNAPATYRFRDYDHLADYLGGNQADAPSIDHDDGAAEAMDGISKEFGAEFKKKGTPFAGSRVYAVGKPGTITDDLWATQNSATGRIPTKNQNVVKNWVGNHAQQELLDRLTFPTNTKAAMNKSGLTRPDVMAANAHAEVNQYVHLALFAAAHGVTVTDIGLTIGSDIAHCAECFWALNALNKKNPGKFRSFTGCENKLFPRWREPWSGFYASYGQNPFRKPDGSFRQSQKTKKDFAPGTYSKDELNAVSVDKIYT